VKAIGTQVNGGYEAIVLHHTFSRGFMEAVLSPRQRGEINLMFLFSEK
jgi:hypothetical protein